MTESLSFYATHSPMTDPGPYVYLYDDLPDDLGTLFRIINNVLFHRDDARDQYRPTSVQTKEQFWRTMQQRLSGIVSLDPAPLTIERGTKDKQLGLCRDFAVFMTSILRHKGYPTRVRAGFGAYFEVEPPYRGDHWVTEYWEATENRWCLVDANFGGSDLDYLENLIKRPFKRGINFTDVKPNEEFYLAPHSWLACRRGTIDSKLYRHNGQWRGWPMLRGNLLHDFQALNKLEMGIFDYWDELHAKPESEMTTKDKAILDRIVEVTLNPDDAFDEMRSLFDGMPRTQVLRSRLHLIGVLGDGGINTTENTADNLLDSDLARLIRLGESQVKEIQQENLVLAESVIEQPIQALKESDDFNGIIIQGARQNNLKNIDVRIPRDKLVVITGVSGSGKSSLAFDTIYAEGQRRYVESLSSFARQFMKQMAKPLVDKITGLNPAVAIEQRTISPNSRSTVGSITEVTGYLRVLFARAGRMHCPKCGRAVEPQSSYQIARQLVRLPSGTYFQVLAPLNRYGRLTPSEVLTQVRKDGFTHLRLDGEIIDLTLQESPTLGRETLAIDLEIADFTIPEHPSGEAVQRFLIQVMEAVDAALEAGKGILIIVLAEDELRLSAESLCPNCGLSLSKLEPRLLNPNTIFGMCLECSGLGLQLQVDPDLIITQPQRSLLDDASQFYMFRNLRKSSSQYWVNYIQSIAAHFGADLEDPWEILPEAFRRTIIYGTGDEKIHVEFGAESETGSFNVSRTRKIPGAIHQINRLYRQTKSENSRRYYRQFMSQLPCPQCNGERLNKEARFVTLASTRYPEIVNKSIGELQTWIQSLKAKLDDRQRAIGAEIIVEIEQRLGFICDVGLHYLSLDRPGSTLSGGEAQRIRLASQIGSELMGVLYVLDEPSIGLHPRDQKALIGLLHHLRDVGNTVLVVEHDADTMSSADWIIDIGPGAGSAGGEIIAEGTPEKIMSYPHSLTGRYLSGVLRVTSGNSKKHRSPKGWLTLRGAQTNNLKCIDVNIPCGMMICVTGVSGSGKSSLITQTLAPALAQVLQNVRDVPGPHDSLEGLEHFQRVFHITQAPIGRNPRSNPGTYVGVLKDVREIFATTDLAKERGYPAGYFSFNTKGGRCEACDGYGANKVRMHFMADVWVRCAECEGKRFMPHILEVCYQGMNIAEVLDLDVQEAYNFFEAHTKVRQMLGTLVDTGLGYIKLGQSATTLSGGEAQRIKLAKELGRNRRGDTLYILDEPTVGLHFADIQKLLDILHRLVDEGGTVLVIEHNLEVIRSADWVIDLGPEGGDRGGYIVAEGTPEDVAANEKSYTGQFLKMLLQKEIQF
jgi:excinuclease ABC subunit A